MMTPMIYTLHISQSNAPKVHDVGGNWVPLVGAQGSGEWIPIIIPIEYPIMV